MSWGERSEKPTVAGAAPTRRILVAGGLAVALAGCVRPLYAPTTLSREGDNVRAALAAIDVPMIPDRLGHTLRNDLVFLLEGREGGAPKRYTLLVATNENVATTIVSSAFQRADAASVQASANYRLIANRDQREVASGSVSGFATYERTPQRFANLRAARDAQLRVARFLAEQIHLQLAAKLATTPG
jgi:LPS-assembly lipoprotein